MFSFLSNGFGIASKAKPAAKPSRRKVILAVEHLEDRQLMATGIMAAPIANAVPKVLPFADKIFVQPTPTVTVVNVLGHSTGTLDPNSPAVVGVLHPTDPLPGNPNASQNQTAATTPSAAAAWILNHATFYAYPHHVVDVDAAIAGIHQK